MESLTSNYVQNLCLENALHGFTRPCILDLKMGSLLYDSDASEEKRKRMINHTITTTSGSLGLRISGLKVSAKYLTSFFRMINPRI
jgi:1D-myo-inositol-tetrakisphosphate 5-kinase/inositol-polyphosphate multikinase